MNSMKCVVVVNILLFQMCRTAYTHEEPKNYLSDSDDDMDSEPMRKSLDDTGMQIDLSPPSLPPSIVADSTSDIFEEDPEIRIITKLSTTTEPITIQEEPSTQKSELKDIDYPSTTTTHMMYTPPRTTGPPMSRRYRRIYNPDESASVSDFPFMAALLMHGELWCGAAIIAPDAVLTAAHCLQLQFNNRFFREYVKMLAVRVGSSNATSGGEVYRVSELFFHPNYKPSTLEFNFAVVKLHKNITLGKDLNIGLIKYSKDNVVPTNTQVAFLGWGSVLGSGDIGGQTLLQRVTLPVYDLADCQEIYGRPQPCIAVFPDEERFPSLKTGNTLVTRGVIRALPYVADIVTRTNFCAGYITLPKNVCNHDAGGPAVLDGILVGILSFSSKRCDQPDQPAVFSRVGAVSDWLGHLWEKKPGLRMHLRTNDILPTGLM